MRWTRTDRDASEILTVRIDGEQVLKIEICAGPDDVVTTIECEIECDSVPTSAGAPATSGR